jgi:drug/metabolite transporter (DMT)-like permease
MRRYSPYRISAVMLLAVCFPLVLVGGSQLSQQDFSFGWPVWACFAFAVVGPLVVTNVLWFTSLDRIGPSRATLAANLQPFVAAVLAVILLSEPLGWLQIAGGVLIALGILAVRRRPTTPQAT